MKKTKLLVAFAVILVLALAGCLVLTACQHTHEWENGKCTVCGEECKHPTYGSDNKCTTCGMSKADVCGGKHTWDATSGACSVCGTPCAHPSYENKVCTVCGMAEPDPCVVNGHTWDAETGKCTVCEKSCTHDWNSETGKCKTCGFTCVHEGEFSDDGICSICGLYVEDRTYCQINGHTWDAETGKCTKCDLECPHRSFDSHRICDVCGWERPWDCKVDGHDWNKETGECKQCDEVCEHKQYYGIYCFVCGHEQAAHSCTADGHEYHYGTCTFCGAVCKHEGGYADNKCKTCGASELSNWLNDTKTYTYRMGPSDLPTEWNPHTYQSNSSTYILDWTESSLYTFDYNEEGTAFRIVPGMASDYAIDVSHEYIGKYGIEAGDYGRVYQIPLKSYLKFDNGDPITAYTFVDSMKLLLDPTAANFRADNVYASGNLKIYGAEEYSKQGSKTSEDCTAGKGVGQGKYTGWDNEAEGFGIPADIAEKIYVDWKANYIFNWASANYGDKYGSIISSRGTAYLMLALYAGDLPDDEWNALLAASNGLQGKTLAEILADEDMLATLNWWINFWCTDPDEEFGFFCYESVWPEVDFEDVGFFAKDAYTLVIVLKNPMVDNFYLRRELCTNFFMVHPESYKACISMDNGVYTNSYGTWDTDQNKANYVGYGPYKLTTYVADNTIQLSRNDTWYGYQEAERAGQYQTTNVSYTVIKEDAARTQAFVKGELEGLGLNAQNISTFINSDYIYYDDSESTWFLVMNPDHDTLAEFQETATPVVAGNKVIKTILDIVEFRKALSFALDRQAFNLELSPTSGVAKCLLSPMIIADPDLGISYRSLDAAKDAILSFWGLSDQWGEGKKYATRDEAIESITGYDPTGAKVLFNTAYEFAVDEGLFEEADIDPENDNWEVQIVIGMPSKSSKFYTNGSLVLQKTWTDAVKGTSFEGHLTFKESEELGSTKFGDYLRNGSVDLLFGVGYGGDQFNPYTMMDCFTGSLQYDQFTDMKTRFLDIELNGKVLRASLYAWVSECLQGKPISATVIVDGKATEDKVTVDGGVNCDFDTRVYILACCEQAIMNISNVFPLMTDASASLRCHRLTYKTEEYILGLGRGGIRYYTYKYDDAEWAAWVKNWCSTNNKSDLTDLYK